QVKSRFNSIYPILAVIDEASIHWDRLRSRGGNVVACNATTADGTRSGYGTVRTTRDSIRVLHLAPPDTVYIVPEKIGRRAQIGIEHVIDADVKTNPTKVHPIIVEGIPMGVVGILTLRQPLITNRGILAVVIKLGQDGGAIAQFLHCLEINV